MHADAHVSTYVDAYSSSDVLVLFYALSSSVTDFTT